MLMAGLGQGRCYVVDSREQGKVDEDEDMRTGEEMKESEARNFSEFSESS